MRKSFYEFMMSFRGIRDKNDPKKQLADWMFHNHDFPKHTNNYDEISRHLEWNTPFPEALSTFDQLWEQYNIEE